MIIYTSSNGEGFDPFLQRLTHRKRTSIRLRPLTTNSRIIANVNILMSIALILLSASWITGRLKLDVQSAIFSAFVLIGWIAASSLALRRELFEVACLPPQHYFKINLFTLEWFLLYLSLSLYLMSIQTLDLHKIPDIALNVLAGLAALMMLIPLAEGSHNALTKNA